MVPPAASIMAWRLARAWRACPAKSPSCTTLPSLSCDTCPEIHTIVPPVVLMPWTYRTGLYTVGAQKASFCMEHLLSRMHYTLLPSPQPFPGGREMRGVFFPLGTKKNGSMASASPWLGFDHP